MSTAGGNTDNTEAKPKNSDSKEEAFVPKNAYEEVSKDMHKYKSQAKEAAAKAAQLEAQMKAIEDAKLMDEKRFEELYAKERAEREKAEAALKNTSEHYLKTVKMSALIRELGNIKPKYLAHADLDAIVVHDDGSLSSESVTAVANKFRQENPELVPGMNAGNQNDVAPSTNGFKQEKPLAIENMSTDMLREVLAKAPKGRHQSATNNNE